MLYYFIFIGSCLFLAWAILLLAIWKDGYKRRKEIGSSTDNTKVVVYPILDIKKYESEGLQIIRKNLEDESKNRIL